MHKDFYIFRHGETDYNLQQRWQGQGINIDLNENGIAQAKILAKRLEGKNIEVFYSSPLKRALQTAQIAAKKYNVPVKTLTELQEGSVGVCEGMKRDDVAQKYPELWEIWFSANEIMDVRWPEGESKLEVQQRMVKAFDMMLKAKEKIIGVASHGASIRYFLRLFGYTSRRMDNAALFHLIYEDGNWTLVNETL